MTTGKAIVLVAGLLLACGSVSAAVYKTVDDQGNITVQAGETVSSDTRA